MATFTVQTNTDVESLIVRAMGVINDVYKMQGDTGVSLNAINIRKITATEEKVNVIFYNVDTLMDVAEFTVTEYVTPSWHDIQEKIAIAI